jgi:hypothetical protein
VNESYPTWYALVDEFFRWTDAHPIKFISFMLLFAFFSLLFTIVQGRNK